MITQYAGMLYDMIDLNSKGFIEFEEFAEFIVNRASLINKSSFNTQADSIKLYSLSSVRSSLKISESVTKSIYIPEIDRVAILEERSSIVKFLIPHVFSNSEWKIDGKSYGSSST